MYFLFTWFLFRADVTFQVDDVLSKDPSIIQPCVTVLKNLTSALYSSLKTDMQVRPMYFGNFN